MSVTAIKAVPNPIANGRIPILYAPSCQSLLTGDIRAALDELTSLLIRSAAQQNVPVLKIDVRGFSDPDEDNAQVVVRQWVKLPPREALHYWDSLGPDYETWLRSYPEARQSTVTDQIAFEIRWTEDEPTL